MLKENSAIIVWKALVQVDVFLRKRLPDRILEGVADPSEWYEIYNLHKTTLEEKLNIDLEVFQYIEDIVLPTLEHDLNTLLGILREIFNIQGSPSFNNGYWTEKVNRQFDTTRSSYSKSLAHLQSILVKSTNLTKEEGVQVINYVTNNGTLVAPFQIKPDHSPQSVTVVSQTSDLSNLIEQLNRRVEEICQNISEEQSKEIREDLEILRSQSEKEKPSKRYCKISAEGLIKAATNLGAIGKPILELVPKILAIIQAMS